MMTTPETTPERPVPGPPVIGVDGEVAILRELLAIERDRLQVARALEVKRDIVFPETTVIVRDIERLLGKVRAKEEGDAADGSDEPDRPSPKARRW